MSNFGMSEERSYTEHEKRFKEEIGDYFNSSPGTFLDKLSNFCKFVPRQHLALFLAKYEIFKQIVEVHGSIIECGVFAGGGLFTWANLSSILEPVNHNRKVIGFDSFEGLQALSSRDKTQDGSNSNLAVEGMYNFNGIDDLKRGLSLYDMNRTLGHIPKVELVKGNAISSIPEYLKNNQHLTVSLLYLDFDLYEPTKIALESFIPRMPKGAIIAFDELNQKNWPGETMAVLDTVGINRLKIKRIPFVPSISYAVLD